MFLPSVLSAGALLLVGVAVSEAAGVAIHLGEQATSVERTGFEILSVALTETGIPVRQGDGADVRADVSIGTPDSSERIAKTAARLDLDELGEDGFFAGTIDDQDSESFVIASAGPRGVLYACTAVADRLKMGERLDQIALREKPVLSHRNLWIWNGPKERARALLNLERIRNAEHDPRMRAFGRYLAQARINAVTFWPGPDLRPDMGPQRPEIYEIYRKLTDFLHDCYGVKCYLFMWYEVKQGTPTPIVGWPICPFDQRVIDYWHERIGRLIDNIPKLRGIVMAGAGGDWVRGPYECQCERCREHTNRELIVRAMKMIGERWAEEGGHIIWKAVTDRPNLVKSEVENFANFDEDLPPYVLIAHKTFYKDFRQPHPFQPIFYAHQDDPPATRPYVCEFQLYGEYRGSDDFPCVMVDRWAEIAPMLARKRYTGAMAVCSISGGDYWDHPLNLANWYAFGRYAWDPNVSPDAIYRDWATLTFGREAADAVIDICRKTYQASTKLMFFRGVVTQNHSRLPTIDYELESSLVGPWHHLPKAPDGYMGREHDVSMYPPEVAEQIRNDPDLQLWAHRVKITPELCDEAIAEKREALEMVRQMATAWSAIPHDAWPKLHADVQRQCERNVVDAELWYEGFRLYFDYKAGRLTRSDLGRRLDDIKTNFDPDKGSGLIRHTYDRFLAEWQRVLDGNLTRISMPGEHHNPEGEPFLPGLKSE